MIVYRIRLEHGKTVPNEVSIIESSTPSVSWAVAGGRQTARCIDVYSYAGDLFWSSGWVEGCDQHTVYYGDAFEPGLVYRLCVTAKDENGDESLPCEVLLCYGSVENWQAMWLYENNAREDAVISFFKDFECDDVPVSACLFVCGLGYSKIFINDEDIFAKPMNPAHSEYENRSYYLVLPQIEKSMKKGGNRIGINVNGAWRSPSNVCYQLTQRIPEFTGKTQMSAILRLQFSNRVEWLITDESWQYFYGPTVSSNIFLGERFEADKIQKDWCYYGVNIDNSEKTALCEAPAKLLLPQTLEVITEQEHWPALSITEPTRGVYSVDFGQNIAGVCRIKIPKDIKAGTTIRIQHMEFLDVDGRLLLIQLRAAASVDIYVAAGGGHDPEYWQPQFTYHGFRYAEIEGYPHQLMKEDIEAVSFYTDIETGSFFKCGSAHVNVVQRNIVQTEKANLHSILTDCPQRDERMGWMNDATARFEATPFSFDIGRLFPKVVRDCIDVQDEEGSITCTAPFAFGARPGDPVCSSFLLAGWMAYLHTGNTDIIKEAYVPYKRWNEFLASKAVNHIVQYSYYGDWAGPSYACQSEEYAVSAVTPGLLMSTGYHYLNTVLLAKMANVIGKTDEAETHKKQAEAIQKAFLNEWWDEETGIVATGSQGSHALALWLDILPVDGRQKAADNMRNDLVEKDYKFTTGNLCTRYLIESLGRYGYADDALKIITREEYPSIGYMIQNEATTIWERFEMKDNPTMNSHNHPMHGSVGYWFYTGLAGLKPIAPSWRKFEIAPQIPEKLLSVNAMIETPYGDATVRWIKRYGNLHIYVCVPDGTRAKVKTPWGFETEVEGGNYHWQNIL